MAASTITRGTFVDGTTPWNSSNISALIYDRIDQMFSGVGGYATLELGGALKINGALTQLSNDGGALGTSSLGWSDLFLASGAVINFNNGDVTLTHSTDALAFAGAANGYTFANGPVRPATNDGAALGTTATQWSDLFLASGSVINFDNGDVTITHSTNTLTFAGAASGYIFNDGNVGIGVTPSAWLSTVTAWQMKNRTAIYETSGGTTGFGNNVFLNSSGNIVYLVTGAAALYDTASGEHRWYNAPSGTAGNTATLTERLRITSGGNIAIGATARLYLDGVAGTGDTYITETGANAMSLFVGGVEGLYMTTSAFYAIKVYDDTTANAVNVNVNTDGRMRRSTSSIRYKHDVATLDGADALAAVMAMRPVTYRGRTDADQRRHVGFIAEEMQQWAPLLCTYDDGGESGTPNYVTYDRVTAYLVAVVQQQQTEINALKARIH